MPAVVDRLLASDDPCVRWRASAKLLGKDSPALRREVAQSERVKTLLSERGPDGTIPCRPYAKWRGAHWLLSTLADIGYPAKDPSLIPLREHELDMLGSGRPAKIIDGRVRGCASIESNAVWSLLALGLDDERIDPLVECMIERQWPDGGWNCDKDPATKISSFHETLIPLRALALYARSKKNAPAKAAAERAADIFLKRRLFRRLRDGEVMCPRFLEFHYPRYWHFDLLFGLVVMAEAGFITDPRCGDALDFVQSKQLPDGGWAADKRWYKVVKRAPGEVSKREFGSTGFSGQSSLVGWGPVGRTRMNEFVTADALMVLGAAGRLTL